MKDIYIIGACRTAIGSFGGSLSGVPAAELGSVVIKEALNRANVKPEQVDEVLMGCICTAGQGQNVARQASIKAGIPEGICAMTVNMVCGSGLKTVMEGARAIACGDAEIVVAGGMENMSMAPYLLPDARNGMRMGDKSVVDSMIKDGLWCAFNDYHMGITAENVADQYKLTREAQDAFAAQSQAKAAAADFSKEIVAVPVKVKKEIVPFEKDEYIRPSTNEESLAKLRPAFTKEGTVTAGNASGINDGAAAVILISGDKMKELGLKPLAKLVACGQDGVDPKIMGIGPVGATKKALAKAGWTVADLDLIEANEAFAAQALAVSSDLQLDPAKTNVKGGAIALGHPIGASGTRILVTLIHTMQEKGLKKGLATLCIGGGMGIAALIEME